jgi:hypothetical protein
MRQASDAAIAVIFGGRPKDAVRALNPEYATRGNGARPTVRRCRRHGPFDAANPDRNVAEKCNGNRRNREA